MQEQLEPVTGEVLQRLLERGLAESGVLVQDHPAPGGPLRAEIIFGTRLDADLGVIFYTDAGGAWFSRGARTRDEDDELFYAETDFPLDAEIPLPRLREDLAEFTVSGQRPTCVEWQPTD